jgi:redox-sensitive bicupin YhaK (pirin superfamily)
VIRIRRSEERGRASHGWLESRHTFSFAEYRDPRHMGFRALRVINEDRVQPGQGFGTHAHRDMEILTCVLEGALEHADSLGTRSVIRPGELQRMSAGTGITHSEFNASQDALVHFLQIWILPERGGLAPGYAQKAFPSAERRGRLRCVASRDGREGSLVVHQDVQVYACELARGERAAHALRPGRHAWLQVARGAVALGGERLAAGDGAAVSDEPGLELAGAEGPGELLLFDLA